MAWDGVELNGTSKKIEGLPEREYEGQHGIRKYIKYLCGMNVGPKANIVVTSKQLLEVDKITTKSGKERAKKIVETRAFEEQWAESEKLIGGVIDVHALYLNQNVTNLINDANRDFVIRLKDETRYIYKDVKGLFENRNVVEHIITRDIKYSKQAKEKDKIKTKIKIEKRAITTVTLNEKKTVSKKVQEKRTQL